MDKDNILTREQVEELENHIWRIGELDSGQVADEYLVLHRTALSLYTAQEAMEKRVEGLKKKWREVSSLTDEFTAEEIKIINEFIADLAGLLAKEGNKTKTINKCSICGGDVNFIHDKGDVFFDDMNFHIGCVCKREKEATDERHDKETG